MLRKLKIWGSVLGLASVMAAGIWFFFVPHWGTAISAEEPWSYAFQFKKDTPIKFQLPSGETEVTFPEDATPLSVIFKTSFYLEDGAQVTEGLLEYNYKYSVRVLLNGVECASLDKNLIQPSLLNPQNQEDGLAVFEHWRPQKIALSEETLKRCLKDGENTLEIIVTNPSDLPVVDLLHKQLLLKTTGIHSGINPLFRLEKPPKVFKGSRLPLLNIHSFGKMIPDEPKIKASLKVIHQEGQKNYLSDSSATYSIKIERRGNTSQSFSKKSYSFHLVDQKGAKQPEVLMGLPKSSKWVLYGPYADKSLIRNALTYTLYREMGNYAPRFRFVDLVVNQNYQGIYLLTEKIQVGPQHLNIPTFHVDSSGAFSGGYVLEIDRNKWRSKLPLKNDSLFLPIWYEPYVPKKEVLSMAAIDSMMLQFNLLEQGIYNDSDLTTHIDIHSFVDYFIISEVSKNIDAYKLSTFIYNKDINSETPRFYIGPIWDYNFAYGLAGHLDGYKPAHFVYNGKDKMPFWWTKLIQNKEFKAYLVERYAYLRTSVLSDQNIHQKIDSLSGICRGSAGLNFKRWDVLNSSDLWPNYYLGKTYDDEINYLKSWIEQRLFFMDHSRLLSQKGKNSLSKY